MFCQCVKFQADNLYNLKVMAMTKFGWTDGQTDRQTYGQGDSSISSKLRLVGEL